MPFHDREIIRLFLLCSNNLIWRISNNNVEASILKHISKPCMPKKEILICGYIFYIMKKIFIPSSLEYLADNIVLNVRQNFCTFVVIVCIIKGVDIFSQNLLPTIKVHSILPCAIYSHADTGEVMPIITFKKRVALHNLEIQIRKWTGVLLINDHCKPKTKTCNIYSTLLDVYTIDALLHDIALHPSLVYITVSAKYNKNLRQQIYKAHRKCA